MKVEQIVTEKIIKALKQGNAPWKKPWKGTYPMNLITKREYRGINVLMLWLDDYKQPYYLTYRQAIKLKGNVKRGEKGALVVYWNIIETKEKTKDGKKKTIPILRYYTVFNVEQCEGLEVPKLNNHSKNDRYERVLDLYKDSPEVQDKSNRASYNLTTDTVHMPNINMFESPQAYYSILFHELVHSTGHEKRLNRFINKDQTQFASESYSKEELVAELGAAFLCARYKIDNSQFENSVAYLRSWIGRLEGDNRLIISAAGKAQKANDYILERR